MTTAVRRGRGTVTMTGSVFCTLRDTWPWPTCAYAAGALTRHLELHGFAADVRIETCRAAGGPRVHAHGLFRRPRPSAEPA